MRSNIKMYLALISAAAFFAIALPGVGQPLEEEVTLELRAQSRDTLVLTAAIPTASGQVLIDEAATVRWIFGSPSKTLEIDLTSPSGEIFSAGDPDTPAVFSRVLPDPADPATTGANYLFVLTNPLVGAWTYEVRETVTLTAPRVVLLDFFPESQVRSGMLGGGQDYRVDRDVRLALITADGGNVLTSLTVDATLQSADGSPFPPQVVNFRDDGAGGDEAAGDGLFTASFLPGSPGAFQVAAKVVGTSSAGTPFQRGAAALFKVHPILGTLTSLFADRGIDLDGDNLLDQIGVAPQMEALEAGRYNLSVVLEASNGASIASNTVVDLPIGMASPEVTFEAEDLKEHLAVDGPFQVKEVRLEQLTLNSSIEVDGVFNLGLTAPYLLTDLEREAIELSGAGDAVGVDTNGNSQFEFLDVTLPFSLLRSGFYRWSARLVDSGGTEVALAANSGSFGSGAASLLLRFSGLAIGENGVDGPYFISDLIVFGAGESQIVDNALTTQAFSASEFEGFVGDTEPPELEVTVAPEVLWPPNHSMIEIAVDISVIDDIDPDPEVRLESITSNEGDNAIGDGNTTDDITVDADGRIFLRAERSGTGSGRVYTLTYSARDAAGNVSFDSAEVRVPKSKGKAL